MGAKVPILPSAREPERRPKLLEREAPFGYLLVLPAVLYLAVFIAYPFLMSIYMSFTDAQAGNPKWEFIGTQNYSKVESYQVLANDFVLATLPDEAAAKRFAAARDSAKVTTEPAGSRFRAVLEAAGTRVPLLELGSEGDASYLGETVGKELSWKVEKRGGQYAVVAHAAEDAPVTFGPYNDKATLNRERRSDILVPAKTTVKTQGKGVMQDPNFRLAVKNTFKYTFGTEAIKLCLGIPCALILNRKFGGRRLLRGLLVIPWVIPIAISAQAWLWILDSTYSVINWCLVHWGILSPGNIINFRGDKNWAMLSVIAVNVWRGFPFTTIVILAGLTAIPDEILERARLDGANGLQRFAYVISPMVRPILMVSLLFSVIFSFTDFNTIWIITKGGPYDQTQVLSTYAYQLGVNAGYLARGAAISLFMFPIMAVMVFFMLQFLRREA
ncbi:MAG TPA: sugar ABC transporter permease [Thermoanaerobaculia bacterium]|nr:sugar ABC transporter permease [Thermoanaerobaculia bacterium]